ncbi:MAG: hypothetical protein DMF80_12325 [Acidobacteria bacterium]|nr:MAG: hypothetical protein DMF80_12325 [Acidobacteriota bacterium]
MSGSILASTFRYSAFALAALVGPGLALQRLAGVAIDPALVLPLGLAFVAGAFWASLATGVSWLFPVLVLLALLGIAVPRRWQRAEGPGLRGALAPLAAIVIPLAVTQYGGNIFSASGEFLLDPFVAFDTAFHVGLARELAIGYPPQLPGVAGFPVGYHFGADLVRAAALRWGQVDPYDAVSRFDVTLAALALLLAVRGAARAAGATAAAVTLAGWTLLATDFSFAFAANPQAHWWADLLRGNILVSLFLANPVVPALAIGLGAVTALSRHEAGEGPGWLGLAAGLAFALPFFKVFLGAHLLLGLGVAALLRPPRGGALAVVAAPCLVATAALAFGRGAETVEVRLAPLDLVAVTRESLGLAPLGGVALLVWSLPWLAASLGLRLFGLPRAAAALRRGPAAGAVLAVMALAAWPLGLLFRVSAPQALEGQKVINDAAYLIEEGGPLLWIFTGMALASWCEGRRRVVLAAAALLALPSSAHFVVKKARLPPDPVPSGVVRAMRALESASRPGDVVMQRPGARYPPLPVVLLGRRVPYERFTPYLTQFAPPEALERRHETVYRFFHTTDRAEAIAIAEEMKARFLCLYGGERVRFDVTGLLAPIDAPPTDEPARCYRWGPTPGEVYPLAVPRVPVSPVGLASAGLRELRDAPLPNAIRRSHGQESFRGPAEAKGGQLTPP